jgi:ADP-heptose:LPS heptosyltransferase
MERSPARQQARVPAERIVVVMPNPLGDGVMATPFLRALRRLYPAAAITALHAPLLRAVLAGLPFVDAAREMPRRPGWADRERVIAWLRSQRFDLAVLLPNSFRSAWLVWRAGIPRRVGYARDGRRSLLTDRLEPVRRSPAQQQQDQCKAFARRLIREQARSRRPERLVRVEQVAHAGGVLGRFRWTYRREDGEEATRSAWAAFPGQGAGDRGGYQPLPAIDSYLELARALGAEPGPGALRMELRVTAAEQEEAAGVLADAGACSGEPLVVLVPGASFGASKCWMPERFARLADRLTDRQGEFGAIVVLAGSPAEAEILARIQQAASSAARDRLISLQQAHRGKGATLGALKAIVQSSRLMICNDTGPRHFAAALGVPVVSLFGPTDPRWAETFWEEERQVRIDVPCGPCQLQRCPIDHRCMTGITVERVLNAARELWR